LRYRHQHLIDFISFLGLGPPAKEESDRRVIDYHGVTAEAMGNGRHIDFG
jgi:hypothetical protein